MSFAIEFLNDPVPENRLQAGETALMGRIKIGDFQESIVFKTDHWLKSDYIHQWVEAIERLLNGGERAKSALITEMYDPKKPKFAMMVWPLFRQGDTVYVQSRYIPYEEFKDPFNLQDFYEHIGNRVVDKENEEYRVSEWTIDIRDLKEWLLKIKE